MAVSQNNSALNKAAFRWLKEAKAPAPDHYLHILNLAYWGLKMQIAAGWGDKAALKQQVDGLFGWKAESVLDWLVSNPNGPPKDEQRDSLQTLLETADDPESAASHVLQTIWSRQVSQNTALQPAASE